MKPVSILFTVGLSALLASCGTSGQMIIPTSETLPSIDDNYTIVWVGTGESYVYRDGTYVRSASNDYAFEVIQRRYGRTWKSTKNMHRIHPDYDGNAGPREQTLFFEIEFSKRGDQILSEVRSSLGNGTGKSDYEYRNQRLQFTAEGISSLAPYNAYRITQHYHYEEGVLRETVELFKRKDGEEIPFVKIEEKASIFRPTALEGAPTTFE